MCVLRKEAHLSRCIKAFTEYLLKLTETFIIPNNAAYQTEGKSRWVLEQTIAFHAHVHSQLNPNPERHNVGQPDPINGTQDFRQNEGGRAQGPDALSAPGPALHPQQHYDASRGLDPQIGAGVGQQSGRVFNDPSQNEGDQAFPTTERQGLAGRDDGVPLAGGGGVGAFDNHGRHPRGANNGITIPGGNHDSMPLQGIQRREEVVGDGTGRGAHNQRGGWDGGNNASMAMRQEERERGGPAQGGWDGGMGVTNGAAPNNPQQGYSDNAGNATGHHTGRHAAEAGAATGAAAGIAHHGQGGHGDGLHNNGDQRQLERDYVGHDGTQTGVGAGTGVNTIPDGSFDQHGVQVERASAGMHPQQNLMRGTGGLQTGGAHHDANPALGTDGGLGAGAQGGRGVYDTGTGSRGVDTGANFASGPGGQTPGAHPTGFGADQGTGAGPTTGTGHPGQTTAGTGSGTGTSSIITGKLQQAAGMLLSNDTMRAKGLEKEAKGEALRNVSHAQELVQEADSLRERAAQKNSGTGAKHAHGVNADNDGRGVSEMKLFT